MATDPDKVYNDPNDGDTDKGERRSRLNNLAQKLLSKRDEAYIYRASSGVERRWEEDQKMLDTLTAKAGTDTIDYAAGTAPPRRTGPTQSKAEINILRGKCNVGAGRFEDILFPTAGRNWGLKVTPVPTLVKGMKDERPAINTETGQPMERDGKPVKAADIASAIMAKAEQAMEGMEKEVDDQLTETEYNAECRKVIRRASQLGTGVLKGPSVVKNVRRAWVLSEDDTGQGYRMQSIEEHRPTSKAVDCRKCYPAPKCGNNVSKTPYMWEYDEALPRDVRQLIGVDGYFDDVLHQILKEDPQRISVRYHDGRREVKRDYLDRGNSYEYWEYNGEVEAEDLMALGCDVDEAGGHSLSACVVFINDRPVKCVLNVLDSMDMPYDFFQWEEVDGSPFGIGIVRMGIWMARVIKAAFRTMMDNGRDSSGANLILKKGIVPADGVWEITGKKIWEAIEDIEDIRKAIFQFQIQNNQAELQAIIELAVRFLDLETELPMMFQGEKMEMPDTLGATNIILDSNNIGIRTRVKRWDDQVTRPHITRYYNWNMQYNDKIEIKGDYCVDPRGASVLLEKEQRKKALLQVFSMRNDGRFDKTADWDKAFELLCEWFDLDIVKTDDKIREEEEAAKNQPPPTDPKIEVANIRATGEMKKAQLNQQADMAELKLKEQIAEEDRRHEAAMKAIDRELKVMEFAQERGITLDKAKAELAKEASKQNLQRELTVVKASGPQVATPAVEPGGRAPEGQAYQK